MQKKSTIEYLDALENAKRALPDASFVSKMESLATNFAKKKKLVSKRYVFLVAASFAILLMGNIFYYLSTDDKYEIAYSNLESEYDLIPTKSMLYD